MHPCARWLTALLTICVLPAQHAAERRGGAIRFHYFDAQVAAANKSHALDTTALQAFGQDWLRQCSQGGQFASLAGTFAPDAGYTATARAGLLKRLDRARFEALAGASWRKATAVLAQDSLDLCVELVDAHDAFVSTTMHGVAGLTAGSGRILLKISVDADWSRALPFALAHELHHSYWAAHHFDPTRPFTLMDYLVFEGRADYFAHSLYSHSLAPWDSALTDAQFDALWPRVRNDLNSTDFRAMRALMFGDPRHDIPRWAGYSVGYRLVSKRMRRKPTLDIAAMTAAPAAAFMPANTQSR